MSAHRGTYAGTRVPLSTEPRRKIARPFPPDEHVARALAHMAAFPGRWFSAHDLSRKAGDSLARNASRLRGLLLEASAAGRCLTREAPDRPGWTQFSHGSPAARVGP
jgi:hypothetical protein